MSVITTESLAREHKVSKNLVISGGVALVSIAAALVAVFGLANWAEASAMHHAVQHVLLFTGGVGVGSSLLALRKRGN